MNRFTRTIVLSCAALFLLCSGLVFTAAADEYAADTAAKALSAKLSKYFVTTKWVNANKGSILIIDTRNNAKYNLGHVKGAINVPSSTYYFERIEGTTPTTIKYATPTPTEFIKLVNSWGIKPGTTVVTYGDADDADWGLSARLVWTLRLYGHERAYNMEGGYPKWAYIDKYKVVTDITPAKPNKKSYVLSGYSDILATRYDVLAVVSGTVTDTVILDARTPEEYTGTASNVPRGGHVPGAVELTWTDVFMDNTHGITDTSTGNVIKVLKPEAELLTLFAGLGVTKDKTIVPYCEGGFRSAHVTLLLLGLGYPSVRHYQGSWYEWRYQDPTTYPANTGSTP